MDLSIPGTTNSPLPTFSVFGDNVQDLLGTGALKIHPSAIIVVNSIDDAVNSSPSVTTLRDAINKANADSGKDLIVFDRSLFSTPDTITLNLGELDITHSLNIIAPRDTLTGADLVTVSGNKASRVFEIGGGATVTLSGLIVADGLVTNDNGGGINNSGTLTLDSSIVRNNSATLSPGNFGSGGGGGGGIYNTGTSTVNNSTISGNSTTQQALSGGGGICNIGTSTVNNSTISGNSASSGGGGIFNKGTSTIHNSTISGNLANLTNGGGIYNFGTLTLDTSTVSNNRSIGAAAENLSGGDGGGIYSAAGTIEVSNSTISNNSTNDRGGGIFNLSNLMVDNSTISGNSSNTPSPSVYIGTGGGIYNSGTSTVNNSTITSNQGTYGGGIYNSGTSTTSTVNNSTISGNSALRNGGGIYNDYTSTLTLLFSTVTQNQAANGGGVYQLDVMPFSTGIRGSNSVRNTIIAANLNSAGGANPDVEGTFTSNGYNLIGDSTGSTGFSSTGDIVGTSANPINPRLGLLKYNGGPTQTIALLKNSPAINAGDPTILPTDPTTDQRGKPRVQGGRADIGAFESAAA